MLVYLAMLDSESDKTKFEQLYLAHRKTMFFAAVRILHDNSLAEDAVHQAFLRLAGNLAKVGETDSPRTRGYLVTIARNCALDSYSKRKNQAGVPFEELTFEPEDGDLPVEECCDSFDGVVMQAMRRLPEHYAAILRLKYVHGLGDAEIAAALAISEENVRKRTQRAKRKLAFLLTESGVKINA